MQQREWPALHSLLTGAASLEPPLLPARPSTSTPGVPPNTHPHSHPLQDPPGLRESTDLEPEGRLQTPALSLASWLALGKLLHGPVPQLPLSERKESLLFWAVVRTSELADWSL